MKLAYQVAAEDVTPASGVTAYQGSLRQSFKRLKECGYDGAELMVCDPKKLDAQGINRLAEEFGLSIPMVCTGEVFGQDRLHFSSEDQDVRREAIKRAKEAIDLAEKIAAPQINIGRLRGGYGFRKERQPFRKRSIEGMREVALYAKEKGILVALEPVNSLAIDFINTTQEGLDVIDEIAVSSMRIMLDSNHMYMEDLDMDRSIVDAAKICTYVHLADSNRLYPGNAKLDFKHFLKHLHASGYEGFVSVEVLQRPDQDTALEKSAQYLRPILENLKK